MVEIDSRFRSRMYPGTSAEIAPNGKKINEGRAGRLESGVTRFPISLDEAKTYKVRYQKIGRKGIQKEDLGKHYPW